jgi:hypothetical protein
VQAPGHYYLHSAVLSCFAIARPLLAKFEAQPDFLVAQDLLGFRLVVFATLVTLLPVLLVWSLLLLARVGGAGLQRTVFLAIVVALGALIALPVFGIFWVQSIPVLAASLITGALLAWSYARLSGVGLFLSFLFPALFIVPAYFLFASPAARLLDLSSTDGSAEYDRLDARFPIVMVVFDEFSVVSLLDETGAIDGERFPNFHTLAETSTWYPNAITSAETTTRAIPSLLTGTAARPGAAPVQTEYPGNLFDRLAGSYNVLAHESGTALCQEPCTRLTQAEDSGLGRLLALHKDAFIVWLHVVTPREARPGLPDISTGWRGFGQDMPVETGRDPLIGNWRSRAAEARNFISRLQQLDRESFLYLHSLLPHYAWEYLPDGRRYSLPESGGVFGVTAEATGSAAANSWADDDWITVQGYRRFLLQLGFVDTLVGEILDALHQAGRFEESLLIITADHGGAFDQRASRRGIEALNLAEIANIPLFIKFPGQLDGVVDYRGASLLDIYPTIMALLDQQQYDGSDGSSLLDPGTGNQELTVQTSSGKLFRFSLEELARSRLAAIRRATRATGTGSFKKVYGAGTLPELHGKSPRAIGYRSSGQQVVIEEQQRLAGLDRAEYFQYMNLRGRLPGADHDHSSRDLAIAINGIICSTTRSYPAGTDAQEFRALLDPDCLREGDNQVEVFRVTGDQLERLAMEASARYSLDIENKLIVGEGDADNYPIVDDAALGWLVTIRNVENEQVSIGGWAANMTEGKPVEKVILFMNGESFMTLHPWRPRPSEAETFSAPGILNSGFDTFLANSKINSGHEVRGFGVYKGKATELYVSDSPERPWQFKKVPPLVPARRP